MAFDKIPAIIPLLLLQWNLAAGVVHPDGESQVSRFQDELGNYHFGYTVASDDGEHFRKEGRDSLGRIVGSYGLSQADGRQRIVNYVADEDGFRAHISSNEPGMASSRSSDLHIEKAGPDIAPSHGPQHLDFAASDAKSSGVDFGDRLKQTSSRVSYINDDKEDKQGAYQEHIDDADHGVLLTNSRGRRPYQPHRGSVIRTSDDTLRRYPSRRPYTTPQDYDIPKDIPRTVPSSRLPPEYAQRRPPLGSYYPPLDPFSAVQPPSYSRPRDPSRDFPYTRQPTRQPSTPPYGGFETRGPLIPPIRDIFDDDDSFKNPPYNPFVYMRGVDGGSKYPAVTMSTIHGGGFNRNNYPTRPSRPDYTRPSRPDYGIPPQSDNRPFIYPGPQDNDGGSRVFTVNGRHLPNKPNLVVRAVAIPNGIRAVHVDPSTGEVYDSPEFPAYDSRNTVPNDNFDIPKDFRNLNTRQHDRFPNYQTPLSYRQPVRESPNFFNSHGNYSSNRRRPLQTHPFLDVTSLSKPSERDLALIARTFDGANNNPQDDQDSLNSGSIDYFPRQPFFYAPSRDYPESARYASYKEDRDRRTDIMPGRDQSYFGPTRLPTQTTLSHGQHEFDHPQFDEPRRSESIREYRSISNTDSEKTVTPAGVEDTTVENKS